MRRKKRRYDVKGRRGEGGNLYKAEALRAIFITLESMPLVDYL
jgi:hypothetical protein